MFKKYKKTKITALVVLAVILVACITGYAIFIHKIKLMNYQPLNKDNLSINKDLKKGDLINFVIFGSDSRNTENMYAGRSDVTMIVSVDPNNKKIKFISIPRDTYVPIPGHGSNRINAAFAFGKEELAIKTINSNFGLNISEYITIDFSGIVKIIDYMGGIELNLTPAEKRFVNSASTTRNSKKLDESTSGLVTLDGEQALVHSRNRTTGGSDYVREDRQRDVLTEIMNKMSSKSFAELYKASDYFLQLVKTNIKVNSYLNQLPKMLLYRNDYSKNVITAQIPSAGIMVSKKIDGMAVVVPDLEKAKEEFIDCIYHN